MCHKATQEFVRQKPTIPQEVAKAGTRYQPSR